MVTRLSSSNLTSTIRRAAAKRNSTTTSGGIPIETSSSPHNLKSHLRCHHQTWVERIAGGGTNMNRAVFLDRDGVLIEDKHYLHRAEHVAFIPGGAAALKRLVEAGFKLFIVSNQSGVGRGHFTLADVELVNQKLVEVLAHASVRFEKIYIAPEAP